MAVVVLYRRQFVLTVPALLLNTVSCDRDRPAMAYLDFARPYSKSLTRAKLGVSRNDDLQMLLQSHY
jgi:hypothetical protein